MGAVIDLMPRDRLAHLEHYRTRHGRLKWYFRIEKGPRTRHGQPMILDSPGVLAEWGDGPLDAFGTRNWSVVSRSRVQIPSGTPVAQLEEWLTNTSPFPHPRQRL